MKWRFGPNHDKLVDTVDEDRNGLIHEREVLKNLHLLSVRPDVILPRLKLEIDMANMVWKLPFFFVCMSCFMIGMFELSPASSISQVHQHIKTHFDIESADGYTSLRSLYDFIEAFELQNRELLPTSTLYWCETRYFQETWDYELSVPKKACSSPRQYALGLTSDAAASWSSWNASQGAERRLSGGDGPSQSGNTQPIPPCLDDDVMLQNMWGDPAVTCAAAVPEVCENDQGVIFCPASCGFCSPFTYNSSVNFEKQQAVLLPLVVWQKRFKKAACTGYGELFQNQPYNPVLNILPAMDGYKDGPILNCIDRTSSEDSEMAFTIDCPDGSPPFVCQDGKVTSTQKHIFQDEAVYPMALLEPSFAIDQMKAIEWLDAQTGSITLATMVYSAVPELFTSVEVTFDIDEAGNVGASWKLMTWRDLIDASKKRFIASLVVCMCLAFFVLTLNLVMGRRGSSLGPFLFENLAWVAFIVYPLVMIIVVLTATSMASEFDDLLSTFLGLENTEPSALYAGIAHYFEVMDQITKDNETLNRVRIFAYITCYVQFAQLIFYFGAHPKVGTLSATVAKAMSHMLHFLFVFGMLFVMLGVMAHFVLGTELDDFGSLSSTFRAQTQMIYGAFIYADGVEYMSGSMLVMYWMYAFTFMIVIFFTLLNFFLAIVVDAFSDVKTEIDALDTMRDFVSDFFGVIYTLCQSYTYGWPTSLRMYTFFQERLDAAEGETETWIEGLQEEDDKHPVVVDAKTIQMIFGKEFGGDKDKSLARMLTHYYQKSHRVLCLSVGPSGKKEAEDL